MKSISIILLSFLLPYVSAAQSSGISGKVVEVTSNQMPGAKNRSPAKNVSREIVVYELTNTTQAQIENGFYKNITTKLVIKKKSKVDGSFKIKLKPGKYSLFVNSKDGLFANVIDEKNNIFPILVERKKFTSIELKVDYDAAY